MKPTNGMDQIGRTVQPTKMTALSLHGWLMTALPLPCKRARSFPTAATRIHCRPQDSMPPRPSAFEETIPGVQRRPWYPFLIRWKDHPISLHQCRLIPFKSRLSTQPTTSNLLRTRMCRNPLSPLGASQAASRNSLDQEQLRIPWPQTQISPLLARSHLLIQSRALPRRAQLTKPMTTWQSSWVCYRHG